MTFTDPLTTQEAIIAASGIAYLFYIMLTMWAERD